MVSKQLLDGPHLGDIKCQLTRNHTAHMSTQSQITVIFSSRPPSPDQSNNHGVKLCGFCDQNLC